MSFQWSCKDEKRRPRSLLINIRYYFQNDLGKVSWNFAHKMVLQICFQGEESKFTFYWKTIRELYTRQCKRLISIRRVILGYFRDAWSNHFIYRETWFKKNILRDPWRTCFAWHVKSLKVKFKYPWFMIRQFFSPWTVTETPCTILHQYHG